MIRDILMYMDKHYVADANLLPVWELGLSLWLRHVLSNPSIGGPFSSQLLEALTADRAGELVDRSLVRASTAMLTALGAVEPSAYEEFFERSYLSLSHEAFQAESEALLSQCSAGDYLQRVDGRLQDEVQRTVQCLDRSTEAKVVAVVYEEFLSRHCQTLARWPNSGLVWMVTNGRFDDVSRMYRLFENVSGGHELMQALLRENLVKQGKAVVAGEGVPAAGAGVSTAVETLARSSTFVTSLLDLRSSHMQLVREALGGNEQFARAFTSGLEEVVNGSTKSPEYMSLFIDERLRRGLRNASEEEIESSLEGVIFLFRLLHEKDVFERYYKIHLAKRLLHNRSVSDDAEKSMVARLKTECGYQFTSKLEGMFRDMAVSESVNADFKEARGKGSVDMSVTMLTTGCWPTPVPPNHVLPAELQAVTDDFTAFYLKRYSGRRVTFHAGLGFADVRFSVGGRRYDLIVTTYQMLVLLCFATSDEPQAVADLAERTGIALPDLCRSVTALTRSTTKQPAVLLRSGTGTTKGRTVTETDMLSVNTKFKSKVYRVKISSGGAGGGTATKEAPSEVAKTREKVVEDRKYQIEAAVVRVMKSRQRLAQSELVALVIRLLSSRFTPDPLLVKERIESLIEREYLEKEGGVYTYLA
jgi:cullin 3